MKRLGNLLLLCLTLLVGPENLGAQAAGAGDRWKTEAAFQRALESRFQNVQWPGGSSLREQVDRLAQWQQVAIFLDRRIDPSQEVTLSARDISLAEVFDQLAAQVGGAATYVGSVVYIGPREQITGLSQIASQRAEEARALPKSQGRRFLNAQRWKWDQLSEPRELLTELAEQGRVAIEGLERVPHDLWPEVSLPPLSWTDRLTMVLAGFGLTFEFAQQGRAVRLVDWPTATWVTRSYQSTLPQTRFAELAAQFPDGQLRSTEGGLELEGTLEDHERLRRLLAQQSAPGRTKPVPPRTVHSLRVSQQQVGAILRVLEQQLGMRVELGPAVAAKLSERVSFDLRDVPLEKILEATLRPAGLTFELGSETIRIQVEER